MEIERADRVVTVPRRAAKERWTEDQAQRWAREEVLFGGPPDKPLSPSTGESISWAEIKNLAGRKVRIRARPMGLIIPLPDGTKRYFPGDATPSSGTTGFTLGTSTEDMRRQADVEGAVRQFAKDLLEGYNKEVTKTIRETQCRKATREFWEAGKRIRDFLAKTKETTQDQVWYALEQWGMGANGYGKRWLRYATYFYDWLSNLGEDDLVFTLSETRIMNILQATKDKEERGRLLEASLQGFFKDFSDEEFKWVTGQSSGTFPLTADLFKEFQTLGVRMATGESLGSQDIARLQAIRQELDTCRGEMSSV